MSRVKQRLSICHQPGCDAQNMWIDEAAKYLGLDRTGIKRPDKSIHRLIKKGALNPNKISGRLVFNWVEFGLPLFFGPGFMRVFPPYSSFLPLAYPDVCVP